MALHHGWRVDDAGRFECYHLEANVYPAPVLILRGGMVASSALPGLEVAVDNILGPEQDD